MIAVAGMCVDDRMLALVLYLCMSLVVVIVCAVVPYETGECEYE